MTKTIGAVLLLCIVGTVEASGQGERHVGFYTGADIASLDFTNIRVGVNFSTRLFGPVELYPGLEVIPKNAGGADYFWQADVYVRVWPFRSDSNPSFWFIGGGAVVRSNATRRALVTGLAFPTGKYRPFIQFQTHGAIEDGQGYVELVAGLYMALH